MATISNQFYYVDNGKPVLKTEYDDGSEDFYDASGQFGGSSWSGVANGTVIDPYGDMAQREADTQFGQASRTGYANPGGSSPGGSSTVPVPNRQRPSADSNGGDGSGQAQAQQPNAAPGVGNNTSSAPAQNGQSNQLNEMNRYNWQDPRAAQTSMMNAFREQGWGTHNNPYLTQLLQAAPGMQTAYAGQRALQGGTQADIAGSYSKFGEFLKNAIGNGQIFSTLQGAQGMFPQLIDNVRDYEQGLASNDPSQQGSLNSNPFSQYLSTNLFTPGQGQGAVEAFGQLFSPFMTPRFGQGYEDVLAGQGSRALDRFQQSGDQTKPNYGGNDWWKYIFGR